MGITLVIPDPCGFIYPKAFTSLNHKQNRNHVSDSKSVWHLKDFSGLSYTILTWNNCFLFSFVYIHLLGIPFTGGI